MAEPILVSAFDLPLYNAKNAESAIEQAVTYLQQVKLDVDIQDSFSGLDMFPNTQGEISTVLGLLEKEQGLLDSYVGVLTSGTQKLEDADAGFEYDLVAETLNEKLKNALGRFLFSATIGSSSLFGAYTLYSQFSSNEGIQKLNDEWDEIPSEFKDAFKEIAGDKGKSICSAINLTLDVMSGECDWDSLETFLKIVEEDGTKASAVVKTLQMIDAPEGTMKDLMDGMYTYQDEAVDEFLDGNIVEGLVCCGKSIGSGLGAIGYGVGEVFTELAADAVDDVLDIVTLPIRFVRHFIPGKVGEAVYNFGDELDAGVDKITGFISDLL